MQKNIPFIHNQHLLDFYFKERKCQPTENEVFVQIKKESSIITSNCTTYDHIKCTKKMH